MSEKPVLFETSETSEVPKASEAPEDSEVSEESKASDEPEAPEVPNVPESSEESGESEESEVSEDSDKKIEVCQEYCVHDHITRQEIPTEEEIYRLSNLFKTFGDVTRIRILTALSKQELCVCDIADLLGMSQSAISHQLRVLKQQELVKFRREGKTVFYSLADAHVYTILAQGLEHVDE